MKRGFTLLEIIVVLGLLAVAIAVLAASLITTSLEHKSSFQSQAAGLLEEELSLLRSLPFADLTARTDTRFLGTLYNNGGWQIKHAADAPSMPNILEFTMAAAPTYKTITDLLALPAPETNNFIFKTKLSRPASFTGQTGLMFRARDLENNYKILLEPTNLIIERELLGLRTELARDVINFAPNAWYTLEVRTASNTLSARLNDVLIREITDTSLTFGRLALVAQNQADVRFDDITLTGATTSTWNFDTDTVGVLSAAWKKFGVYDLSEGIDFLTISNYLGQTNIKQVTTRIDWRENNATSSVSSTTLITQ